MDDIRYESIKIRYVKTKEEAVVSRPEDIKERMEFVVIEKNPSSDNSGYTLEDYLS